LAGRCGLAIRLPTVLAAAEEARAELGRATTTEAPHFRHSALAWADRNRGPREICSFVSRGASGRLIALGWDSPAACEQEKESRRKP
jgi:hypothetical protein